ncbi:MAG: hypothetical protein MJ172_03755 [Clostridia bacterium]|nr:hypothetical protein [Clostridia bacterium]
MPALTMAQKNMNRTKKDDSIFVSPDLEVVDSELEKNYLEYISEVEVGSHATKVLTESYQSLELSKTERRKIRAQKLSYSIIGSIICFIIVVAGVLMMLVLYPQAQLSELSRSNSEAKDRISALKQELSDVEENNNGITDMDIIKSQALALGMQEPNANQVVTVPMPKEDKFITMSGYSADGVSEEAYNAAIQNLAEYYQDR